MTRRLVLASASPARLQLLRDAGFAPDVVVSGVDEDATGITEPRPLALALAVQKAEAVAARTTDALVVGCDSVLDVDGEAVGKPSSADDARARLRQLRGRRATLVTGHCVIDTATGQQAADVEATVVRFGKPDDAELDALIGSGEPLLVAGAFTLLGRSGPFLAGIEGDPGNVIGLSLPLLRRLLADLDVRITDLWC